jgi:uncharacterized phage-associated protein
MANVFDVAKYILKKQGQMTAMKLQKLVYYSQAWSVVWDSKPLFQEPVQAWANGPVVPELYKIHQGQFLIQDLPVGSEAELTNGEKETVDAVLGFYGGMAPQVLSDLTHSEDPWKLARKGLCDGERGEQEISLTSMEEFYSSLPE